MYKLLITVLLLCFSSVLSLNTILLPPDKELKGHENLAKCANEIVKWHFHNDLRTAIINLENDTSGNIAVMVMFKKLLTITTIMYRYRPGVKMSYQPRIVKIQHVIMFVSDIDSKVVGEVLNEISSNVFDFGGVFMIVMTNDNMNKAAQVGNAIEIFRVCWEKRVVRIIILFSYENQIFIYTFFPFNPNDCNNTDPVIMDVWDEEHGFQNKADLFPHKSTNLHGCPLRIATFPLVPLVILEKENSSQGFVVEGVEGCLLNLLSEKLNFTYSIHLPSSLDDGWGSRMRNGSYSGVFGMLRDKKVDLMMAGMIITAERNRFFEPTRSYHSIRLVFAVSKGKQLSYFPKLGYPFQYEVWLIIIAIFIVALLAILSINYCKRFVNESVRAYVLGDYYNAPILDLWSSFVGNPVRVYPIANVSRYLLIVWVLYSFIMRLSYQTSLVFFMTKNFYEPNIDTVQQMLDQNFTFGGLNSVKYLVSQIDTISDRFIPITSEENDDMLKKMSCSYQQMALVQISDVIEDYNQRNARNGTVNIAKEVLRTSQLVFYLQKPSFIKRSIDKKIKYFMYSGLITKYYAKFTKPPEFIAQTKRSNEPIVLGLHHVSSCFVILGIGLVFSTIVFVVEVCYNNKKKTLKTQS